MITVAKIRAQEFAIEALIEELEAEHGHQARMRHIGHMMLNEAQNVTGLKIIAPDAGIKPGAS